MPVHAFDDSPTTFPLHDAVLATDPEAVRQALAAGHDPRASNGDRQSPLHALLMKHWEPDSATNLFLYPNRTLRALEILNLFLDAGVSPNLRNGLGETLLNVALRVADNATEQALRLTLALRLVQAGADVATPGPQGSALWTAMAAVAPTGTGSTWGMDEVRRVPVAPPCGEPLIEALLALNAPIELPALRLTPLVTDGILDLRGVRYAVPHGADRLGVLPDESETVALRAVRSRSMAVLEHVLALGADVSAMGLLVRDKPRAMLPRTPAMLAVEMGWDDGLDRVVRALQDQPDGLGLTREMAQPMWQADSLRTLPGFQRLERRALEQGLGPTGSARRPRL